MRLRTLVAALAVCSSAVRAATPLHLAPSSQWVVNYADNSCQLIRRFGDGADATSLAFESEAPGAMDMMAIGRPLATSADDIPVKFLPVESEVMHATAQRTAKTDVPAVLVTNVSLLPIEVIKGEERKQKEQHVHPNARPPATSLAERAARKAVLCRERGRLARRRDQGLRSMQPELAARLGRRS